jgi:hypothetical protein
MFNQPLLMASSASSRVRLDTEQFDDVDATDPYIILEINNSGDVKVYSSADPSGTVVYSWKISGAATDYDIKWELDSGNTNEFTSTTAVSTWADMSTTQTYEKHNAAGSPGVDTIGLAFTIRDTATLATLVTATITLAPDRS